MKPLHDFFAEAEAEQAAGRPGAEWPFPIDRLINGVAWFCTEAPWWVVVLVALPFIAVGIRYLRSLSNARKALRSR